MTDEGMKAYITLYPEDFRYAQWLGYDLDAIYRADPQPPIDFLVLIQDVGGKRRINSIMKPDGTSVKVRDFKITE